MRPKRTSSYKPGQIRKATREINLPREEIVAPALRSKKWEQGKMETPDEWAQSRMQRWREVVPATNIQSLTEHPLNPHEKTVVSSMLTHLMSDTLRTFHHSESTLGEMIQKALSRSHSLHDLLQEPARVNEDMKKLNRSNTPNKTAIFMRMIFLGPQWKRALLLTSTTLTYAHLLRMANVSVSPEHLANWIAQNNPELKNPSDVSRLLTPANVEKMGKAWIQNQADLAQKKVLARAQPEAVKRAEALEKALASFEGILLPPAFKQELRAEAHSLVARGQYGQEKVLRKKAVEFALEELQHTLHEIGVLNPGRTLEELGVSLDTPEGINRLIEIQRVANHSSSATQRKRMITKMVQRRADRKKMGLGPLLRRIITARRLTTKDLDQLKTALLSDGASAFPAGSVQRAIRYWILMEMATRVQTRPVETQRVIGWIPLPNQRAKVVQAIQELKAQGVLAESGDNLRFTRQGEAQIRHYDLRTRVREQGKVSVITKQFPFGPKSNVRP